MMNEKRKRGAPKGNQNARKHGFYSKVLEDRSFPGTSNPEIGRTVET